MEKTESIRKTVLQRIDLATSEVSDRKLIYKERETSRPGISFILSG